jgi:hypothetical protein
VVSKERYGGREEETRAPLTGYAKSEFARVVIKKTVEEGALP